MQSVRIVQSFLSHLHDRQLLPTGKDVKIPIHVYDALKNGGAIELKHAERFFQVLNSKRPNSPFNLHDQVEPIMHGEFVPFADLAAKLGTAFMESSNGIIQSVSNFPAKLQSSFMEKPAMLCRECDIEMAARAIQEDIGRDSLKIGEPEDSEYCKNKGAEVMAKFGAIDNYIDWLRGIYQVNPQSVMFAVAGAANTRVGTCVTIPLTKSAFHAFTRGELADQNITKEHICERSEYLFVHIANGICDSLKVVPGIKPGGRSRAIQSAIILQVSKLSRGFRHLFLTSVGPSPTSKQKLDAAGFYTEGKCIPGTHVPIYRFPLPPGSRTFRDEFSIIVIKALRKAFWKANKEIWTKYNA